jgi:DDE superfamily endonuclease
MPLQVRIWRSIFHSKPLCVAVHSTPEPVRYLNNVVEQDHRSIERRVNASQGFRLFEGAWRTIQGYEVVHMIRKGQVRWLPKADVLGQIQFIRETLRLKSWLIDAEQTCLVPRQNRFFNTSVLCAESRLPF